MQLIPLPALQLNKLQALALPNSHRAHGATNHESANHHRPSLIAVRHLIVRHWQCPGAHIYHYFCLDISSPGILTLITSSLDSNSQEQALDHLIANSYLSGKIFKFADSKRAGGNLFYLSMETPMTGKYKAIPLAPIARDTKVDRHTYNYQAGILPDAPAIYVMTDFKDITPFAIDPAASIDAANDKMIACGVRLLFVTSSDGSLLGLVTSTDILGEKPVQYLREHGGPRSDIQVLDIMTPHDQLEALQLTDVVAATVGDIIETMKAVNRKHMLVIETSQAITGESIRGMFSATQISRQTGIEISLAGRASTFAELKRAIAPA